MLRQGTSTLLGEIDFPQVTQFSAAELRSLFLIQQGDIFDTHKIRKGMEEVRKAYAAKGFVKFAAVPTTTISENNSVISLTIDADEGKQFHIGRVDVLGVNPALTKKLLNEAGLGAGSIFDRPRLMAFFEKIRAILPEIGSEGRHTEHYDEEQGVVDLTIDFRRCVPE